MSIAKKSVLAGLAAVLAVTSGIALAQTASEPAPDQAPALEDEAGGDAMDRRDGRRGWMSRLDEDGSGDISADEFGNRRLGWLVEGDEDGDGVLSMDEITAAVEQRRQERREARLLRRFDIDGDGEVTVEELERQQEEWFALLDRNDDGALSREEMRRGDGMRGHHRGRMHHGMGHGPKWHHGR